MATLEDFIFNRLSNDADVSGVVGTRIYRVKMPDNATLPAITYQVISGAFDETREGPSGMAMPVVGVDCWARSAGATQALAAHARDALHPFRGTYSDLEIHGVWEWTHFELYDAETEIFHVSCSCRVWYS